MLSIEFYKILRRKIKNNKHKIKKKKTSLENLEQQSRTDRENSQHPNICLETENVQTNDNEIPSRTKQYNLRKRIYPDCSEKRPYTKIAKRKTNLNSQSANKESHTNSVQDI